MKATLVGTPGEDREGGVAIDADGNVYEALAADGSGRRPDECRREGRRAHRVRPGRHETLDEAVRYARHRPRLRACSRSRRASRHRRVHEGQLRRQACGEHERRRLRDEARPEWFREWTTQLGSAGSPPIAATALRSTARARSTSPATRRAISRERRISVTRTSFSRARARRRAPLWIRQFGTAGEDKGMAVAIGGGAVYLGGMVTSSLGTPLPGTTPGELMVPRSVRRAPVPSWTKQIGTTGDEQSGASPPTRPATRRWPST